MGIYIQVGAKRRIALLLRVEDPETLVFGYEVKSDDRDTDGASVENRYRGTGFLILTKGIMDIGILAAGTESRAINRLCRGLGDDTGHLVLPQGLKAEPVILP